jgi:hypothetical protein
MSLLDEVASVLYHECDEETWNYGSIADSILQLPTDMEVVEKCNGLYHVPYRNGSYEKWEVCEYCHGTNKIVRPLMLGEAVDVLKNVLKEIDQDEIEYFAGGRYHVTLPDGIRVRIKK